jgi:hypothetical protein
MANVTTQGRGTIVITGLDADWTYTTDGGFDAGIGCLVSSIQFLPSAQNDIMQVHDGGVDGALIFDSGPAGGTAPIFKNFDPPRWVRPVIDITDCNLDTEADAKVIIDIV